MNRIFRLVWDQLKKCWVVTSELARGRGKTRRGAGDPRRKPWWALVPLAAPLLAMAAGPAAAAERVQPPVRPAADAAFPVARVAPPVRPAATAGVAPGAASGPSVADPAGSLPAADALPGNGQVTAGSGTIRQDGLTTTIEQDSRTLSLTWDSFDIGADGTVRFLQPDALSIAVNRILGSDASMIFGRLEANGQVFLINPNGVLFGEGAQVNVGGLVASTLDVDDASLGSDRLTFNGDSTAGIVNKGTITASNGGYIALLGHQVSNQGTITAQLGSVALAGGNTVTLDFDGQRLLGIQVDRNLVDALAENHQLVVADGGQVLMSAGAKDSLLASVVNNTGVVQARTVANRDGRIVLLGGMQAGTTHVAGTLDASAPTTGDGGFIETSAATVRVADGATVTTLAADGATGTWLVDPTDFTVSAGGAAQTVSGIGADTLSSNLETSHITLTTAAPGSDPGDISVDAAVGWNANTTLALVADNDIQLNAPVTAPNGGLELDAAGGIQATASIDVGTFTLIDGNWRQLGAALPAFEADDFRLQGGTFLRALGGDGSAANPYQLTDVYGLQGVDSISLLGRHFVLANDIDASGTANWNGGLGFDPIGGISDRFTGMFDGLGHVIRGLTIDRPAEYYVGVFSRTGGSALRNVGLEGASVRGHRYVGGLVGSNDGTISQSYATGAVKGELFVGGLLGANYYGTISQSYATGVVTGLQYVGGLVGQNWSGTISQSYSTGVVRGDRDVGGLVGVRTGSATTLDSYWDIETSGRANSAGGTGLATAELIAALPAGFDAGVWSNAGNQTTPFLVGLAGNRVFNINDLPAGVITATNRPALYTVIQDVEQLQAMQKDLGERYLLGNDIDASATASWNGGLGFDPIGDLPNHFTGVFDGLGHVIRDLTIDRPTREHVGLFGYIDGGELRNVGLEGGSVRGHGQVGNLVGTSFGATISRSHATGVVSGNLHVGGLVGSNVGMISQSYATGAVSGDTLIGGLVGYNMGSIHQSYATGAVSGGTSVGGLVGRHDGTIDESYATGAVNGLSGLGGLVGRTHGSATTTDSYWDTETSGQATSDGGTGLTTAQLQAGLPAGFDLAAWDIVSGESYPYLLWQFASGTKPQVVSGFVYNDAGSTAAGAGLEVSGLVGGNTMASALTGGNVTTGANGYYYYLLAPGTLDGTSDVLTYVQASGAQPDGAALADNTGEHVGNLDIYGDALHVVTASGALSSVSAGLLGALGSNPAATALVGGLDNLHIDALGAFNLDASDPLAGNLVLNSDVDDSGDGGITQSEAVEVAGTSAFDANTGNIVLTNALNDFGGVVDLAGANIALTDLNALTLGNVQANTLDATSGGTLTLTTDLAMDALTLDAGNDIRARAIDVGTFTLEGGNWRQLGSVLPAFEADDFRLQGGTFLRALGGNGSVADPYQVTDVYGLQGVDSISLLGSHFALANDIDASGTANWNGGLGFDPIGDIDYAFDGEFDGLGHVISGLVIDRPAEEYVGLFGFTIISELRNVGLAGGNIAGADHVGGLVGFQVGGTINQSYATGAVSGGHNVGGLVGRNSGVINQSYATGTVHGDDDDVGGLVGSQVGGTISQSYATGAVSGQFEVGGLVGQSSDGTISRSYATGAVSGASDVGGLVGHQSGGTVSQSYATGSVSGDQYVGGLVGLNFSGTINQSYATGSVSGVSGVGGLVGENFDAAATTTDSYWDTETTGQATSAGGTGLTTAELIAAMPDGFDAGVWSNAGNQTTPFLVGLAGNRVFNINDLPAGTITATNRPSLYTVIQDVDQLQAIENRLGGRYVLGNDIDASGTASWNGGLGFNPIGNGLNPFVGVFDGLGHVISGLTIDRPMQDYVGLFGSTDGSELRNVGLEDGSVRGDRYVGGLVGNQREGTISQSYATGAVSGRLVVGGLVGFNTLGTINQSYATAEINGSDSIGGLVGFNRRGTIDQSYATGAVYADSKIGGLVGYDLDGTIRDSYATGAVEGRFNVGGLIGYHEDGTISRSYATGEVDGYNFIGGLVGNMLNATIDQSYATGTVNGERGVGGLVGQSSFGTISQSYATGTVNGGVVVGGLVGSAWRGTISQSYATGTVNGEGGVGGLVGSNEGTISQSYATGAVSGDISIGGLIGYSNSGAISQSYATGAVSGVITIGGLVGGVSGGSISQSYATGAVDGDNEVGGLVGDRTGSATTTDSYWDIETTGQAASAGGTGLTTAQMMDAASFVGWDLATEGGSSATWRIYEGHTAPLLRAFMTDLVVASNDVTTTYDGNDFAGSSDFTFGAVAPGFWHPDGTVDTTLIEGAADTSGEARDAGTYALDAGPWSSQRGYDIAYTAGTLTIDPKAITVDATADDKVYDGTTDATATLASGGVVAGDDIAFDGTATFADKNVGTGKTVSVDGIAASGADAGNYSFNTTATTTADISQLAVTVDATADDKVYDGTTAATATLASGGVIAGDDIAFNGTATFADKNAGTGKTVTVDGIAASGTDAGNYSFNTSATDTADISQLAITVDATADDKVYDGTTAATATLASNGVITGDDIGFDGTAMFGDKNVGTGKTVTVEGIAASGTDAGNYSFNTTATDTADITPATLVYVAAPDTIFAGQQPTGFEGQVTGLVAGETLEEATDGTLAWTTPATVDSAPGAYAIEGSGLGAANYVFEQAPGNATALTVIHGRAPFAATSLVAALQDLEGSDGEEPLHAPDITIIAGGARLP